MSETHLDYRHSLLLLYFVVVVIIEECFNMALHNANSCNKLFFLLILKIEPIFA